jgi:trehalose/maltose hydrolase-like predicted phosphorylase
LKGHTIDIEFEEIQKDLIPIFIYFIEPQDIIIRDNENEKLVTFVSSIDINRDTVLAEINIALKLISSNLNDELYAKHARYFSNIWDNGRIEVDNFELQKTIYASSYY